MCHGRRSLAERTRSGNVKNEKEEFEKSCVKPMLIKEAEDLIKEGEQLKERMNKVKATYENYLKVLEEYQSAFEG